MNHLRTQVGIVGAGPAGLMLAHLLHLQGIESVIVELRSRQYAEERVRAGVLEQTSVDLLRDTGVGERMLQQGLVHKGLELGFRRNRHRIDLSELTGKCVTVYGQHEVVKDLIARRLADGGTIFFEAIGATLHEIGSEAPSISFLHGDEQHELRCDFIAGCDGFHGISRPSVPAGALTFFDRSYPFAWLGILAQAPPSKHELVYQNSDRGFALYSMRSPTLTRLYLQCEPDEDITRWPDDRIWQELALRLQGHDGWTPTEGLVVQKSVTGMRSFVTSPMQYGRLFLVGDAAHIVPPTGAKGMNLALTDAIVLSRALAKNYQTSSTETLDRYSDDCLRRVWQVQRFSWWMTSMLHNFTNQNPFDRQRQLAELEYVVTSRAAAQTLAENYVGLPLIG